MLRWNLQTVRVAGGCDSVLHKFRFRGAPFSVYRHVVVSDFHRPLTRPMSYFLCQPLHTDSSLPGGHVGRRAKSSSRSAPLDIHATALGSPVVSLVSTESADMIGTDEVHANIPRTGSDTRIAEFERHAQSNESGATHTHSAAQQCYEPMCDSSPHPEVHLSYLRALLADPSADHLEEFFIHMAGILRRSLRVHPSIRKLFFESLVSHVNIPFHVKQELTSAILQAVGDPTRNDSPDGGATQPGAPVASRNPSHSLTGAHDLVVALEEAIFGRLGNSPGHHPDPVAQWACTVTRHVFSIAGKEIGSVETRWSCLMLLALVRTGASEWSGQSAETVGDAIGRAAVMEWQTVCVLAAMENLLDSSSPSAVGPLPVEVVQGFSGVLRKLWHDWTAIPVSAAPRRPLLVSRLLCASFIRLVGRLEDKVLVDACREHCIANGLWSFRESNSDSTAGLQTLAAEQLYAALKCGTFFERALVDLVVCVADMGILRAAVDTAILRFARSDVEHAHELIAWARHRGIAPSEQVIARVGISLARRGFGSYFDRYVTHPLLSADRRALVAAAYLNMFTKHGRQLIEPREFVRIGATIVKLAAQVKDPSLLLMDLQSALLVLIREGYGAKAVIMFEHLAAQFPAALSSASYQELLRVLVRHRRFKLARRVLTLCTPTHPDMAARWTSMLLLGSSRSGASRLVARLAKTAPMSDPLRLAAQALSREGRKPAPSAAASTIPSPGPYDVASDPTVALLTIQRLVRAERFHAARKLFDRIRQQENPELSTTAGNTILHGAARRASRGQRVRVLVHTYRTLTEKHAFMPDRVTFNIVLQTLLLSGGVDTRTARGLFDAVVRIGYPSGLASEAGAGLPPAALFSVEPPVSLTIQGLDFPKPTGPIMYMRHARPLYRTFVKAFYGLGDVAAAQKVVGIMKVLEAQNAGLLARGTDWVVGGETA